jgi:serine/threonine protein kinase
MPADPNRVAAIFAAALSHESTNQRAAYLDEACAGDAELRGRVETLLRAYADAGSYLEKPAAGTGITADAAAGQWIDRDGPPPTEAPGTRVGPYKLLQQIGEGGMGTVWMAEQERPVRRMVALKIVKPGMDSAAVVARFEAERQALALMDHPNIAKVFDGGAADGGRPYFVMELVKGIPITRYCDENRLTPRERLELFVPVCQAVQHAHQKGIIHRDLKPSNVLVASYDGRPVPKVIDFGVAKATGQKLTEKTLFTGFGALVGTLEYMAPEQAEFNALDIDTRSDIYSLGVLLYELLTGSTPLTRQQLKEAALTETLRLIREKDPPKPSTRLTTSDALPSISAQRRTEPAKLARLVRGELDWIVMKALEKDRARRYETANGLGRDVQRYLRHEPVEAGPPSHWYRLRTWARRNGGWGPLLISAFILLSLPALLLWALITNLQLATVRLVHNRELQDTNTRLLLVLHQKELESLENQAVADFLRRDVLGQESGARRPDPDPRLRTALDRAARRLEDRPITNPRAELRARALLTTAYEDVGEEEKAKAQRDRVLVLSRQMLEPSRKVLAASRERWGERHPCTLRNALELADLCYWLENYDEAEQLLLACYRQLEVPPKGARVRFGPSEDEDLHEFMEWLERPSQLAETLEGLVRLYDAWGRKAQADEWRKKWAEARAATNPPGNGDNK